MNILQPLNAVFFIGLVVQFGIRHHFIQRTKSERKTVQQIDWIEKLLLAAVLPAALLLPPLYCIRTPREERLMCEEFGDDYREYIRGTGRLFPRLTPKAAEPQK